MSTPNIRYVDNAQALDAACAACARGDVLAIDTEFERTSTYFARPALFQLFDGHTVYLLDPLAITDLSEFSRLLHSDRTAVIMHAASEDLGLFRQVTGQPLARLYDTQIAAGFCGFESGRGYHHLVQDILNIEVSKDQTRSNWLRRPLSAAQLNYAALDVYYLPALHGWLNQRLESLGRSDWLGEEMALFLARVEVSEAQRDYQKLVKNLPDNAPARSRLMHLCEWRDELARQRNAPRRQLLEDSQLLDIANTFPLDSVALSEFRQRHRPSRRARPGDLEAIAGYLASAPARELPPTAQSLGSYRKTLREMQDIVRVCAKRLNLPPAVLASKRMLENCITHVLILKAADLPIEFRGWRRDFLAEPLLECLQDA